MAPEGVPRAGTHRDGAADAPHVALQVAGGRVVLEALVQECHARDAEVVAAGERDVVVVQVRTTNLLIAFEAEADLDRTIVVDGVAAPAVRVTQFLCVVAGIGTGGTRPVAQRDLAAEREAGERRRVVAQRVAEARVEAAVSLGQRSLRPDVGRRQDRRRVRGNVTEDRVHVVEGHQELAHLERAPRPLEADERFATAEVAAVGIAVDARFDLEDGGEPTTQCLGATNAETRRVRAQAAHRRIRAVGLTTVDELEVDVKPAVQRHVRSLRIRSQRSGENARDGDSNELLFH